MFEGVKKILMDRDNLSSDEADELLEQAEEQFDKYVANGDCDSAYHINEEFFGLEPDYLL